MSDIKVSNNLTFCVRTKSAKNASEALFKYNEQDKESIKWLQEGNEMPIFFDTNVLLNIYDISEKERDSFIKFLQKNKKRVYISSQVQREYLRHRVLQIRGVKSRITKIKNEIATTAGEIDKLIENKLGGIKGVAYRSVVKYGMPRTYECLNKIIEKLSDDQFTKQIAEAQTIANELNDVLAKECRGFEIISRYETNDALLTAIAELQFTNPLDDQEKQYVIDLYKSIKVLYDKADNEMARETLTFPGSGDKDKSVESDEYESVAWGDLYIYCDILKFMKEHDTDVLFITRDVTKGDWLRKDSKSPFPHYIENSFEQTGHIMFIKDSDRYLPLVTENNPDIDSIVTDSESNGSTEEPSITDKYSEIETHQQQIIGNNFEDSIEDEMFCANTSLHTFGIRKYRKITKEIFMSELHICCDWASSYGAGYVNVNYFIYDILGQKKYDFESCRTILRTLQNDSLVSVKTENHEGRDVECISIIGESSKNESIRV